MTFTAGERGNTTTPELSVIIPAHRCAGTLQLTMDALVASDLPRHRWEMIVVDDASGDGTAAVAAARADWVVALEGAANGPAFARNRGAQQARGDILAFVDADVLVHQDTLRLLIDCLERDPAVAAVFGAYDTRPTAPGLVSRYRNLMHHYVHTINSGDAETFWAGCGAVRRAVFAQVGGFDERRYKRPQIEDIELGHRIRDLGLRIVLRPDIQCTHLKRWTLANLIRSDVRDRGAPWVELLLEEGTGARASTLNVRNTEKVFVLLTGIALGSVIAAVVFQDWRWTLLAVVCVTATLAGNARMISWFWREHGAALALVAIPMRLLHYVLSGIAVLFGSWHHRMSRGTRRNRGVDRTAIALTGDSPQVG